MGLNKAYDRSFFVIGGSVKTTGGSINLAKGQLAIVDQSKGTAEGAAVVSTFAGKPKKAKDFSLRVGVSDLDPNRSFSNKAESTSIFSINEVTGLRVSAPKQTEQIVDDLTVGYDGINADTAFSFKTGDAFFRISVELSGDAIAYLGGGVSSQMVSVNVEIPNCDPFDSCTDCDNCDTVDCKAITLEAIERLKRATINGGAKVEDVVEITPVFDCDSAVTATLIPYDYYTLSVCDTGGDEALSLVQAQYNAPVIRIDRQGATSVYQVLLVQSDGAPNDYRQTIASIIKGCDTCPAGYTAVDGGVLYAFTIEDDGVDKSALFTALPAYVATTIKRAAGHSAGIGFYTAVFTRDLTDAEITTFLGGTVPSNTATIDKVGLVSAICTNSTVTDIAWVVGDTCNAVTEEYEITLPDTSCGDDRLAELQGAYKDLTIAIQTEDSVNSQRIITLTGTSGTANITVTGTSTAYLATFATSLTVTATNFVTTHAAALLANEGITVTSLGATLIFTHTTTAFPTITAPVNATGNLAGTIGAETVVLQNVVGGCKTKYTTTVVSNLVCDNCDPIFNDYYRTNAPESYENHKWVKVVDTTTSPNGNCLCGIRFKGKTFGINADDCLRDVAGFVETSTKIQVSAGYPSEIREGIGTLPKGVFEGNYTTRFSPRTHLGGNLLNLEKEGHSYFASRPYRQSPLERVLRGETSSIEDQLVQYIQYTLTISNFSHTGGFAGRSNVDIDYHIFVEVGKHTAVENLLNDLASNANVSPVRAFGI